MVLESPPPLSSHILALRGHWFLLENLPYCKCKEPSGCSWCNRNGSLQKLPVFSTKAGRNIIIRGNVRGRQIPPNCMQMIELVQPFD